MFEVVKTLKPGKILENLDNANLQIIKENNQKPLIKIPIQADLNNYLARYKKEKV